MARKFGRAYLWLFILIVLGVLAFGGAKGARAQGGSNWLANEAPQLDKAVDLSTNSLDVPGNTNCSLGVYKMPGLEAPKQACTFNSPLGALTTSGMILIGANKLAVLDGPSPGSHFIPTVDASLAVVSLRAPGTGNYLGVYRHLTKASLRSEIGSHYEVEAQPDELLRNPQTGELLEVDASALAYSANGEWMITDIPHVGLARVRMSDLGVDLFVGSVEPSWYLGLATMPLAISDDGRYVAANTGIFGSSILMLYDLSTCESQLNIPAEKQQYCASKDIWNGDLSRQGIKSVLSDVAYPVRLRFVSDDSLSFEARYDITSDEDYKAASFVATAFGAQRHGLGLLGMGDSYISGQGASDYREGTDTKNNGCHVSELAYPFLLGAADFDSYNSVACSGARTFDLTGSDPNYAGQVRDKVPKSKRDRASVLSGFLPGYIYQQEFSAAYQPKVIVLSVGGDDIGFADIVKTCVANSGGGTCYDTYEDRAELANEIDATYAKLVATYAALREQSGGARLYVVGYPQVAKPGGDCDANVHLDSQEVLFASQLINYLDGVVQRAAQTAGAFYVDTQSAFDGHRLCEPGDKAMNGLTRGNDGGPTVLGKTINVIGAESYHPTPLGYRLLANTIAKATNSLSAAMPNASAFEVPTFNPNTPLLQGLPSTGRQVNWVTNDDTVTSDLMFSGDAQQVTVNGSEVQLQPGSKYQVVLHSDPILLGEGSVDAEGNITTTIRIPASVQPGFHVLHIYGTSMAGEPVDIQKALYVAASTDDYDGDGILNAINPCLIVSPSGVDSDGDGIDDACDTSASTLVPQASISGKVEAWAVVEGEYRLADASPGAVAQRTPLVGSVLGAATQQTDTATAVTRKSTDGHVVADQLYRLNWNFVWAVGVGMTTGLTLMFRLVRRE